MKLTYQIFGSNNKKKVVFLHGFLGISYDFMPIIKDLQNDYCCISIDLPGHNNPKYIDKFASYDFATTSLQIITLMKNFNINKFSLCGYSMGGRLALYLYSKYPQFIKALFLISVNPGLESLQAKQSRLMQDQKLMEIIKSIGIKNFIDYWYKKDLFRDFTQHENYKFTYQQRLQQNLLGIIKAMDDLGLGKQLSLWQFASSHKKIIHWMVGEKDYKFTKIAHKLKHKSAHNIMTIVPSCGHVLHLENPQFCSNFIKNQLVRFCL